MASQRDKPQTGGMFGDVEVQNVATAVADHEETVQYPEGGGGHGKKVHGGDSLTMVLEKRQPALARVWRRAPLRQVPGYGGLGDFEPQFQELAVNPGSAPSRILGRHGSDEIAKLRGDCRSAATAARKGAPVAAETSAMPAHDGLRFHDHQRARPFRPPTPEAQPEETIAKPQLGSGVLTFEDADLLPQGEELQSRVMSRAKEGTEPREKSKKKLYHGRSYTAQSTGRRV